MDFHELLNQLHLLTSDPRKYLELCHEVVKQNPQDRNAFFVRHQAWSTLGRNDLALADIDKAIALSEPDFFLHHSRGLVLRDLNRHQEAIDEFNRSRAMDPESWVYIFGPLHRAHSHALLGHLEEALADSADLLDDHWTPRLHGAPGGTKREVTEKLRQLAIAARQR